MAQPCCLRIMRPRPGRLSTFLLTLSLAALAVTVYTSSFACAGQAPPQRFDNTVRSDMFAGMAGDQEALNRAMKRCEDALERNPKNEEALVWHGSGLVYQAGQLFRSGDYTNGKVAVIRGLREMDDAVALAPDSITVLIPRGASLLGYATHSSDPARSRPQLEKGLADYEKVLAIQKSAWNTLPAHSRGELLSGLVTGWLRAGDPAKARDYAQRIVGDLPGSRYAARAQDVLTQTSPPAQLDWQCIGCHAGSH